MGQLLEAIADPANLHRAWTSVRANGGAAGIDGQSIASFETDLERQLGALRRRLLSAERYVPPPVRRVEIPKPDGRIEFLGFSVAGRFLRPRPKSLDAFKDKVRRLTRRKAPVSLLHMIEDLNPVIRGWGNYYALGDVVSLFEDLDKWIRMRLRSKARTRFKSKGGIDHVRFPNRFFDRAGLVRLERLARRRHLSPA